MILFEPHAFWYLKISKEKKQASVVALEFLVGF